MDLKFVLFVEEACLFSGRFNFVLLRTGIKVLRENGGACFLTLFDTEIYKVEALFKVGRENEKF